MSWRTASLICVDRVGDICSRGATDDPARGVGVAVSSVNKTKLARRNMRGPRISPFSTAVTQSHIVRSDGSFSPASRSAVNPWSSQICRLCTPQIAFWAMTCAGRGRGLILRIPQNDVRGSRSSPGTTVYLERSIVGDISRRRVRSSDNAIFGDHECKYWLLRARCVRRSGDRRELATVGFAESCCATEVVLMQNTSITMPTKCRRNFGVLIHPPMFAI